jgi:aminoglycoside phosphotransferase family enzyme
MLYLPQERMMNVLLERDQVSNKMVDAVARKLAVFHAEAETNPRISAYGALEAIRFNTEENFAQTEKYFGSTITVRRYDRSKFTSEFLRKKKPVNQRVTNGRIRDATEISTPSISVSLTASVYAIALSLTALSYWM